MRTAGLSVIVVGIFMWTMVGDILGRTSKMIRMTCMFLISLGVLSFIIY